MIPHSVIEKAILEKVKFWLEAGRQRIDDLHVIPAKSLCCPAASDDHGDRVFAVFNEERRAFDFLANPVVLSHEIKELLELNEFTKKNRLAGKCLTSGCEYWQEACRLGDFVSQVSVSVGCSAGACAISETCRWRAENGPRICGACAYMRNLPVNSGSMDQLQTTRDNATTE